MDETYWLPPSDHLMAPQEGVSTPAVHLLDAAASALQDLGPQLSGCLLYLDDGAAEAISHVASYRNLRELGVVHVQRLEDASAADAAAMRVLLAGRPVQKLVVAVTRPLPACQSALLQALQAHPDVLSALVLCGVSEEGHVTSGLTGARGYQDSAQQLAWQALAIRASSQPAAEVAVRVQYCALLESVVLDAAAFVLPAHSTAASARLHGSAAGYAPAGSFQAGASDDEEAGTDDDAGGARQGEPQQRGVGGAGVGLLAHALVGVMAAAGLRCDAFALGPASRAIAREVATTAVPPVHHGSAPSDLAALLLLDRAADLLTPAGAAPGEHLLAQAFEALPRRRVGGGDSPAGWRCADVEVALAVGPDPGEEDEGAGGADRVSSATGAGCSPAVLGSGRLCQPGDARAAQWLSFLVGRGGREAPLLVRKWMREALRQAGVQPKMRFKAGQVLPSEMERLVRLLASQPPSTLLAHGAALQLGAATAQLLGDRHAPRLEALGREQRAALLAAAQGQEQAAEHATQLLAAAARGGGDGGAPPLPGVLLLLLALYCALADTQGGRAAPFGPRQEEKIRDALLDAVMGGGLPLEQLQWLGPVLAERAARASPPGPREDSGGGAELRTLVEDRVTQVLDRMRGLAAAGPSAAPRCGHRFDAQDGSVSPLLRRLMGAILDGNPLPDLSHSAGSISGLLASGLGRFGLRKQPAPGDHGTLVVFVVGGVTMTEIAAIRHEVELRAAEGRPVPHVVIGGTALLDSSQLLTHVCGMTA